MDMKRAVDLEVGVGMWVCPGALGCKHEVHQERLNCRYRYLGVMLIGGGPLY